MKAQDENNVAQGEQIDSIKSELVSLTEVVNGKAVITATSVEQEPIKNEQLASLQANLEAC